MYEEHEEHPTPRVRNRRRVNLQRLKVFAIEQLPRNSALRDILLAERDEIDAKDFLAKMGIWLALLDMEIAERASA